MTDMQTSINLEQPSPLNTGALRLIVALGVFVVVFLGVVILPYRADVRQPDGTFRTEWQFGQPIEQTHVEVLPPTARANPVASLVVMAATVAAIAALLASLLWHEALADAVYALWAERGALWHALLDTLRQIVAAVRSGTASGRP